MPLTGLGTAFIPFEALQQVILTALDLGYRKLDTAWLYGNEQIVGETLKKCGIPRDQIFLTTKIHANNLYWRESSRFAIQKKSIRKAIEQHCQRLKTDKIDLLLIHWPFRKYRQIYEAIVR